MSTVDILATKPSAEEAQKYTDYLVERGFNVEKIAEDCADPVFGPRLFILMIASNDVLQEDVSRLQEDVSKLEGERRSWTATAADAIGRAHAAESSLKALNAALAGLFDRAATIRAEEAEAEVDALRAELAGRDGAQ